MTSETEVTPRERIKAVARDLGLTVTAEFVPFSQSRNAKAGAKVMEMSLNWRVTLKRALLDGIVTFMEVLTTDYSAGIGHCPGYSTRMTTDVVNSITLECEHGRRHRNDSYISPVFGNPILPDTCDVLHSLALDSDVLDSGSFEEWASNFGYDPDSRKAEALYRQCLEIALKLRNGIGEDGLARLREACQDY